MLRYSDDADMKSKRKLWPRLAVLVASLLVLAALLFVACDFLGIGPNIGLPVGYYGRFNRVLARIEASPDIVVVRTTLHRDVELEDFYITVRTQDNREVRLRFEEAHTRPYDELLQELRRVGL